MNFPLIRKNAPDILTNIRGVLVTHRGFEPRTLRRLRRRSEMPPYFFCSCFMPGISSCPSQDISNEPQRTTPDILTDTRGGLVTHRGFEPRTP